MPRSFMQITILSLFSIIFVCCVNTIVESPGFYLIRQEMKLAALGKCVGVGSGRSQNLDIARGKAVGSVNSKLYQVCSTEMCRMAKQEQVEVGKNSEVYEILCHPGFQNPFEKIIQSHLDGVLILDEITSYDPKTEFYTIYILAELKGEALLEAQQTILDDAKK